MIFFKGNLNFQPSENNKIGVVFDKAIPQEVLNIHINTIGAVKTVYGVDVIGYEITKNNVGVEFYIDENEISTGGVKNIETVYEAVEKLIKNGAQAVCGRGRRRSYLGSFGGMHPKPLAYVRAQTRGDSACR